jgi:hypothetical protein
MMYIRFFFHTIYGVELSPFNVVNMNYILIISVIVERSFSQYKNILRSTCSYSSIVQITFLNLKAYVVSHCFNS